MRLIFRFLSVGGVGVVSVASNLFPRAMVKLQKAGETVEISRARAIHQAHYPLFRDLFMDSNPVPIKSRCTRGLVWGQQYAGPLVDMGAKSVELLMASLKSAGSSPE